MTSLLTSHFRRYHHARFFHPVLSLIAAGTNSELAKYVEYLKQENRILRSHLAKKCLDWINQQVEMG